MLLWFLFYENRLGKKCVKFLHTVVGRNFSLVSFAFEFILKDVNNL